MGLQTSRLKELIIFAAWMERRKNVTELSVNTHNTISVTPSLPKETSNVKTKQQKSELMPFKGTRHVQIQDKNTFLQATKKQLIYMKRKNKLSST